MRDATAVTPVQAGEISAVLAKRLFETIDRSAAAEAADAYAEVYRRNRSLLPEEAASVRFHDRMLDHYPFHPTLIDFLNNKLAQAENFQGTRGVLRTLAMTIRSIWSRRTAVPLIHVGNIDLRSGAVVSELLGRTGNADLRQVLNADVGSVDTANLQGGLSNAQLADARNPHPDGLPFYELTWKVVFLNSLVGRAEGKASRVFGVTQQEAMFQLTTPLLAPSQVRIALDAISESAFYLRFADGKYFAHIEPTINSILARIRQTIDGRQVQQKLKNVSDQLIRDFAFFHVEHDVRYPQDISDNRETPTVAVVSLSAGEINVKEMFQYRGDAAPRVRQNTVLLLVPKTVHVLGAEEEQLSLHPSRADEEAVSRLENIARQVLAIETLKSRPDAYGVNASMLHSPEFAEKDKERSIALQAVVAEMYDGFYFCEQNAYVRKELRTVGSEGGATILSQIGQSLMDAGKLIWPEKVAPGATLCKQLADNYFFKAEDRAGCAELLDRFLNYRSWPMLAEGHKTLESLLRKGVECGVWASYKRSEDPTDSLPAEFYSDRKELPYSVQLLSGGYSIMTMAGAKRRGWTESDGVPNETVREEIRGVMSASGAATVEDLTRLVQAGHANATEEQVRDSIRDLVQGGGFSLYAGSVRQSARPGELVNGFSAYSHPIRSDEVLISRTEETERGWNSVARGFRCSGTDGAGKLRALLGRLGSLYTRGGALSDVDELDISDLRLLSGGRLRVCVENATAADMKRLDELFQELANVVKFDERTEAEVRIDHPADNCALVKKLKE